MSGPHSSCVEDTTPSEDDWQQQNYAEGRELTSWGQVPSVELCLSGSIGWTINAPAAATVIAIAIANGCS